MAKMLRYCRNLTHLTLGHFSSHSGGSDKQLREAIQEMHHLEALDMHVVVVQFSHTLTLRLH